jgi:hypothetical protein
MHNVEISGELAADNVIEELLHEERHGKTMQIK